jgi:hypothetical protein
MQIWPAPLEQASSGNPLCRWLCTPQRGCGIEGRIALKFGLEIELPKARRQHPIVRSWRTGEMAKGPDLRAFCHGCPIQKQDPGG